MKLPHWSELPGPSAFIQRMVNHIRRGENVLLSVPGNSPPDFEDVFIKVVHEELDIEVTPIDQIDGRPLEILIRQLKIQSGYDWPISEIKQLTESDNFRDRVFTLRISEAESWHHWSEFIRDFSEINRNIDEFYRSTFLVLIDEKNAIPLPPAGILLKCVRLQGVVDPFDTSFYAYHQVREKAWPEIKKQLAVAMAREIALWDLPLCNELIKGGLRNLFNPHGILSSFAERLKWSRYTGSSEEILRQNGIIQRHGGEERFHSAYCILMEGGSDRIAHRIWKAQVQVLFPFIEIRKRQISDEMETHIDLPHRTETGILVENIKDLEIGHLYHQFSQKVGIDPKVRDTVSLLREIRNCLALICIFINSFGK